MTTTLNLKTIEIDTNFRGMQEVLHPVLIWDNREAVLIDVGIPFRLPLFLEAMAQEGIPSHMLKKIILTHHDLDHIGGLTELLNAFPHKIDVLSTEEEKPYIQGEQPHLKITPAFIDQFRAALPAELPSERRNAILHLLEHPPTAKVDQIVTDREELPLFGGIEVIHTPGHTPGHISLYLKQHKLLIAGDAMMIDKGRFVEPDNCVDADLAKLSLRKLLSYDIQAVICYHGGHCEDNVKQRIEQLAYS
ncbi:Glyoxylase, beta-lactamase superfamily II [Paenibacillus catalpae]|uniref:Glyoxylase, beta-lactamase superfamily II n=1 Tax=Paenibacillus catalpae TaxID=1045775 RepID=A0A1I1VFW7_9BACL|nr:MBL fold metallo-hydrolase [Paenibacillus catalpae]SFD79983.1 Glyoxylase, beta-lactamase superfamily II [Paenibacillus catalpae]